MKKLLVLAALMVSASAFAMDETALFQELEALNAAYQNLASQEQARFEEEKAAADQAAAALANDEQVYAALSERAQKLSGEANTKFYKDQYEELASKYEKALNQLSKKMEAERQIISDFQKIQSIRGN